MAEYDEYDLQKIHYLLGCEPKVLYCFKRAFAGQEHDSLGWVVQDNKDKSHLILMKQGSYYKGTRKEIKNDIHRLEELINDAEEALNILNSAK
jgi:hypothetical protein